VSVDDVSSHFAISHFAVSHVPGLGSGLGLHCRLAKWETAKWHVTVDEACDSLDRVVFHYLFHVIRTSSLNICYEIDALARCKCHDSIVCILQ